MKYKNQVFDVQFFSSKDAESLNVNDSDIMFKFEDKEDFNLTNNVFQKIDSGMHIKTKDRMKSIEGGRHDQVGNKTRNQRNIRGDAHNGNQAELQRDREKI